MPPAVGSTGLYLEAVLRNYQNPDVPEDVPLPRELKGLPKYRISRHLQSIAWGVWGEDGRVSLGTGAST